MNSISDNAVVLQLRDLMIEKFDYPLRGTTDAIWPSVSDQLTVGETNEMIYCAEDPSWKDEIKHQVRKAYHRAFAWLSAIK